MVNKNVCIGCGGCVGICPVEAISLTEEGIAQIDYNKCIKCLSCQNFCPVNAIKIK